MDNILTLPPMDDKITGIHVLRHSPFNMTDTGYNSEIRIVINSPEVYLPHSSYITLEGKLESDLYNADLQIISNGLCYMFQSITYLLNGTEVDSIRNVGLTSTLKGLLSFETHELNALENAGFGNPNDENIALPSALLNPDTHRFNVIIPLKYLMGFFEDHKNFILDMPQELLLVRSSNDLNCLKGKPTHTNLKLNLDKISWAMPQIKLSDEERAKMYSTVRQNVSIPLAFRSWDIHEYPSLPTTNKLVWPIRTTTSLNRPRYVAACFYVNKRNKLEVNNALPDAVELKSYRLFLNDKQYPFQEPNVNIKKGIISELYLNYSQFQQAYYHKHYSSPLMTRKTFSKSPIIVFDCSKQDESVREAVDIRLEIETDADFPDNTSCIVLIIHEKLLSYNPLNKDVIKH